MATRETVTLPTVGEQGEPCATCGAPLAADQRYCLNCGARRANPELGYPGVTGAPDQLAVQAGGEGTETPAGEAKAGGRDQSPLIAVGAIAVLGLMLLVGVLIGRGDGDQTVTTAAPAAQQTTTTADTNQQASTNAPATDKKNQKKDKGGGKSGKSGGKEKAPPPPKDAVVADDSLLQGLESNSAKQQQEASKNLPDTVALPGEPPKTDNKEPGGGSDSTVIK